jgi:hypothetical protein
MPEAIRNKKSAQFELWSGGLKTGPVCSGGCILLLPVGDDLTLVDLDSKRYRAREQHIIASHAGQSPIQSKIGIGVGYV